MEKTFIESQMYANDISDINSFLEVKEQLEKYKKFTFTLDNKICEKYMILQSNSNRRIGQKTKVGYRYQTLLFNKKYNKFELVDKMHKNIIKKKLNEMSKDEFILRKCLLEMSQGDHIVFSIPGEGEFTEIFEKIKNKLLGFKKTERKKEYKEEMIMKSKEKKIIESKNENNKESKDNSENNNKDIKEDNKKNNFTIPEEELKKVEEEFDFEKAIYYRIFVEEITRDRPAFPNNFKDIPNYVNFFNIEIRELISRNEINNGISWCNEAIQKVLHMSKKKLGELKDKKNDKIRAEIYKEIKKTILNKTYLLSRNISNEPRKNAEEAVKLIETEFYGSKLGSLLDENFVKITGRYIKFCVDLREFGKAEDGMNRLEKCNKIKECQEVKKWCEEYIKSKKIIAKEKVKKRINIINIEQKENVNNNIEMWGKSQTNEEVNSTLEKVKNELDNVWNDIEKNNEL